MGSSVRRTLTTWAALAILAVTAMAVVVVVDSSRDQGRAVLPRPWSGEVRYEPVEAEQLCAGIGWDSLAVESEITVGEVQARTGNLTAGSDVLCSLLDLEADFLDPARSYQSRADLVVIVLDHPQDARSAYEVFTGPRTRPDPRVVESEVGGWWTSGRSLEWASTERTEPDSVSYQIYFVNLYVSVTLAGSPVDGTVVDRLHEFARAVVDEARAQLPCRPLTGVPAAACG